MRKLAFTALTILLPLLPGCGGGSSSSPTSTLSMTLAPTLATVASDGTTASVSATLSGASSPTLSFSGLPTGVSASYTLANSGSTANLTFTGSATAAPGTSTVSVTASSGSQSVTKSLTLISAPVVKFTSTVDTALGKAGLFKQALSTSFQLASWDGNFFGTDTTNRETTLNALNSAHIRVQVLEQARPMLTNTGTSADWDFTMLDRTLQPILTVSDKSPEFQIATVPAWMADSTGKLDITNHLDDFATYAANLVRYYNKGGFTWGGQKFVSPSSTTITYWGILNEPAYNNLSATEYATIYNKVVPAMLAVDPTIKFLAVEYAGSVLGTGWPSDPEVYLPSLFAATGGLAAQTDVVANHFYSTCNQSDTDATVMATIPKFAAVTSYIYAQIARRSDLANVPVWTTEENVNADYSNGSGMSSCNPTQAFVTDKRGTSSFFAAWQPYMFLAQGKAGNQGFYHWSYDSDQQYGEVDGSSSTYLSYWVDKALSDSYPRNAAGNEEILTSTVDDSDEIEALATKNSSTGVVTVTVVNHGVASSTDNNGTGVNRTVVLDLSSLGSFTSATQLTLDSTTSSTTGAKAASITVASRLPITLNGYSTVILKLVP